MQNVRKVTCVIFFYNEERHIEQAIESVINQTTHVDEIIVSDDYSTDNSPHIIKALATKYPQLKYVLSEKKGKFHAYKTGLKYVSNPYFFILAGDDALKLSYVENGLAYLMENTLNFFYSSYLICDSGLRKCKKSKTANLKLDKTKMLMKNWSGGFLFGKSSIIPNLLKLESENILFEDWVCSLRLVSEFNYVHTDSNYNYLYRRHPQATTIRLSRTKLRERDIKLYYFLLQTPLFTFSMEERDLIAKRIVMHESFIKGRIKFSVLLKLIFARKGITYTEKIKLIIMFFLKVKEEHIY